MMVVLEVPLNRGWTISLGYFTVLYAAHRTVSGTCSGQHTVVSDLEFFKCYFGQPAIGSYKVYFPGNPMEQYVETCLCQHAMASDLDTMNIEVQWYR